MKKIKLLAFVDNPLGRDTEILLPVTYLFEKHFNIEVKYKFIWDLLNIKIWRPDVILLPNVRGHNLYVEIAYFARKAGIIVLALDSEGNFPTDGSFDYWGYNKSKEIVQEWVTCWSQKTVDYAKTIIPTNGHNKIILTGATGFDRYLFMPQTSRAEMLGSLDAGHFTKVIGYAGWAFGKIHSHRKEESFVRFFPENRSYAWEWLENQRINVHEILKTAIQNNPKILFILKKHPKEDFEDQPIEGLNEMNELIHYPNVRYIKNEFPIEDLISTSDIWTGFETTTLFEAWLLKKPTIVLNNEVNFPRVPHYKGSLIAKDQNEFQSYIDAHFNEHNLETRLPTQTIANRTSLMNAAIGFHDGFNHLRTLYYFRHSIPQVSAKKEIPLNWRHLRLYLLMHVGRFFYHKKLFLKLPGFRKSIYVFENRNLPHFEKRKEKVYSALRGFHQKMKISPFLDENKWGDLSDFLRRNSE
jgi:hypothetical protein